MNIMKKLCAVILSFFIVFTATGCSNTSWIMRTEDTELPIGVYIFYMSQSYSQAYYKVPSYYLGVLEQEIDGQPASEFIEKNTLDYCKKLIAVEKEFDERGLSITKEEMDKAEELTNSHWKQYGTVYEGFGVSKESFHRASTLYNIKYEKVYNDIYGEDGTKNTTDEDIENYYLDNYTSYSYFVKSLYTVDDSDGDSKTRSLTTEEVADIESEFNSYISDIENGASISSIESKYKEKNGPDNNITNTEENLENTILPKDVKNQIIEMQNDTAKAIKAENSYYFIYKNNIKDKLGKLSDGDTKQKVLDELNSKDFDNRLLSKADTLDIKINQKAIKKYTPDMFEKDKNKK